MRELLRALASGPPVVGQVSCSLRAPVCVQLWYHPARLYICMDVLSVCDRADCDCGATPRACTYVYVLSVCDRAGSPSRSCMHVLPVCDGWRGGGGRS